MTADKPLSEVDFLNYMDSFKQGIYGKLNKQNRELGEVSTDVKNVKVDVKALEGKSDKWDRLNSVGIFFGAVITGVISAFKK